MEQKDKHLLVGSTSFTFTSAVVTFLTYQTDESGNPWAWIPAIGVLIGVPMIIVAISTVCIRRGRHRQQDKFAQTIAYDSSIGDENLKMYFDTSNRKLIICAATTKSTRQEYIRDFVKLSAVEAGGSLVALDKTSNTVVRASSKDGEISCSQCCINEWLRGLGVEIKESVPNVKVANKYTFITDDINEFIVIVTPEQIHTHRYSEIIGFSYEENAFEVYSKRIRKDIGGVLLYGGVETVGRCDNSQHSVDREIKSMSIKIQLRDTDEPNIVLNIFGGKQEEYAIHTKFKDYQKFYEGLLKEVFDIKDILSLIIDSQVKIVDIQAKAEDIQAKAVDNPRPKAEPHSRQTSTIGIADELTKFAKLKEQGFITEEEYEIQKKRLLRL